MCSAIDQSKRKFIGTPHRRARNFSNQLVLAYDKVWMDLDPVFTPAVPRVAYVFEQTQ